MVAKSYQKYQTGEPYRGAGGRMYVDLLNADGTKYRTVRWYTEAEYQRMYPDEKIDRSKDPYFKTQKEVLGFNKGYITIFKGNTYEDREYFKLSKARYARHWGWYFVSTEDLPDDIPDDVIPVRLPWGLVGNEDGKLKPEDQVVAAVESLIYDPDPSEYVGDVGDKLDLYLTVDKVIPLESVYGVSRLHNMHDDCGNVFVWITAARSLEVGKEYHLKGTVKEHKQYKNCKQTILTRCREVAE